jgi:hypothetical protein
LTTSNIWGLNYKYGYKYLCGWGHTYYLVLLLFAYFYMGSHYMTRLLWNSWSSCLSRTESACWFYFTDEKTESARGLICARSQLESERGRTWSWTFQNHLQPFLSHYAGAIRNESCRWNSCPVHSHFHYGLKFKPSPSQNEIFQLLALVLPFIAQKGNSSWDFSGPYSHSLSLSSLSQVTPWPTIMADPSLPLTRTQTQPSPTVPCPTKGLSGTRTVTVSTWWGDMGTITTVRWVDCDSPEWTKL